MSLKKVLVIDDSEKSNERLVLLINNITDFKADVPTDKENAKELFDNNSYEFVIVEHNCKKSHDFMNFALEVKPKQKMILLSDSLNCPMDCDTCASKFNFVRLIKPITIEGIAKYFVNFEDNNFICPNKYRFDKVDTLEKLHEFIYLDENYFFTQKELKDDTLYITSKLNSTLRFEELIKIEDYINKRYFNFKLTEDNKILITKI